MPSEGNNKIILLFSIPLTIFVIVVSYAGLFIPATYTNETANWQAQALAQDLFDLLLVAPLLLITSWFAHRGNRIALLLWAGTIVYIIYTFVLFCFAVHFNFLFIIYCLTLGLSFYAFLYFLFSQNKEHFTNWTTDKLPVKTVGYYFIILVVMFYFLWLSEIIPAILNNTIPTSITEAGQITNPVHVLDLAVLLPGLIYISLNLLKRKSWAILLAPVVLIFFILMTIAIGTMVVVLNMKGFESDLSVAVFMILLAIFSLILLIWYLRSLKRNSV
jgi:hypothetical protein